MNEPEHSGPGTEKQKCPRCGAPLPPGPLQGLCAACLLKQGAMTDGGTQARGAAFEPPTLEEVRRLFPQLEILALIGKGGMGAVYKARQPALDRLVALKILASHSSDPGFAERFSREARALAKLSHPNIVAVHEFGEVNGLNYFIMEFVDGVNLRQLEQAGRLSAREALQIVPQICDALQFAHDTGIVHRDIKPENVLMDTRGRVKIADFGIAKIMDQQPRDPFITGTRDVMGTPHYMAPEQVERPQEVDHRADIYSLGVVFYELLTGELPLGRFQPPSKRVTIDVRLDEIVLRALEKAPEMRYQQAGELKTQVETLAQPPTMPAGKSDAAAQSNAETPQAMPSQRLSRAAVVGAAWITLFFAVVPAFLWHEVSTHEFERGGPFASGLAAFCFFVFEFPAFVAPFGATLLGWISVAQIRRSGGRLHGMWLAVFDGLFFPLLALDGGLFFLGARSFGPILRRYLSANGVRETLLWDSSLPVYAALLLLVIGALDFFLIRRVWRAVHANMPRTETVAGSPAAAKTSRNPLRWAVTLGVLAVFTVFAVLGVLAVASIYWSISAPAARRDQSKLPSGIVIERNGHSVMVEHDALSAHYVLYYDGHFTTSSRGSENNASVAWTDHGIIDLPNGRTFSYSRASGSPEFLEVNGTMFNLREGRVLVLQDEGTARQLKLFPSLPEARDVDSVAQLVPSAAGSTDALRKLKGHLEASRALLADLQKTHSPTHEKVLEAKQNIAKLSGQVSELVDHPGESPELAEAKVNLRQAQQTMKADHPHVMELQKRVKELSVRQVSAVSYLELAAYEPIRWRIPALVAEADSAELEPGELVDFTLEPFPYARFKGWVSQVSPIMERVQNEVVCRTVVEVADPDPKLFKQGMTAIVYITLPKEKPAFGAVIEPVLKPYSGDERIFLWALNLGSGQPMHYPPTAARGSANREVLRTALIDAYAPAKAERASTLHCVDMLLVPLGAAGWDTPAAEVAAQLKKAQQSWNFLPVEVDIDAAQPHAFLTRDGAKGVLQFTDRLRFKPLLDGEPRRPRDLSTGR